MKNIFTFVIPQQIVWRFNSDIKGNGLIWRLIFMRISKIFSGFFLAVVAGFLLLGTSGCRDDGFDTNPDLSLSFSKDSLLFDTVFTTVGSATRSFKVYNHHNRRIRLSSVSLAGGTDSYFRINVDGASGTILRDVEIEARDSIFVFVEVTLDPVNQSLPLIVTDSVVFSLNGRMQDVKLVAWGQDANFIYPNTVTPDGLQYHLISQDAVWDDALPWVIYGLAVAGQGVNLRVTEGARVHFHNNASLIFLSGASLKVEGTAEMPVSFQGDRPEALYRELPGQWGRIWLSATSRDHDINHAIIKNGTVGLHVDTIGSTSGPTLRIRNTQIRNMTLVGLLAQGSWVDAENLLIANCGEHAMILALGGRYAFRHTTLANFFSLINHPIRRTPSLVLNNYFIDENNNVQYRPFEQLYFANSIIYGSVNEEVFFNFLEGSQDEYLFDHCLLRTENNVFTPSFPGVILNQNPLFNDSRYNDYRLTENSPAIGAGNPDVSAQVPVDLAGNPRTERSDIGALQYVPIDDENGE